jgi:RNA polymerase-binding transcription factor DksA
MTKKLTDKDLERFRGLLDQARRMLVGDLEGLEADAFSGSRERVSVDNPADIGSDRNSQEFSLELLERDEATLGEVLEALERIEAGTFGRCEKCGHWLRKTRLAALPYARNCIDCQRLLEQEG